MRRARQQPRGPSGQLKTSAGHSLQLRGIQGTSVFHLCQKVRVSWEPAYVHPRKQREVDSPWFGGQAPSSECFSV